MKSSFTAKRCVLSAGMSAGSLQERRGELMKQRNGNQVTRRVFLGLIGVVASGAIQVPAQAGPSAITVHKDPNCGCCSGWVRHLQDAGFAVQVDETLELELLRTRLGVPPELAACHTAEVDGYLIEGHVPAAAVRRLLAERPEGKGLAVPGMPAGSPGMEGGTPQSYAVLLFGAHGHVPFMRFVGGQVVD